MDWTAILFILGAALLVWLGFRMVRGRPELFSKENLSKSVFTFGILALILIGVIGFCVLLLRS